MCMSAPVLLCAPVCSGWKGVGVHAWMHVCKCACAHNSAQTLLASVSLSVCVYRCGCMCWGLLAPSICLPSSLWGGGGAAAPPPFNSPPSHLFFSRGFISAEHFLPLAGVLLQAWKIHLPKFKRARGSGGGGRSYLAQSSVGSRIFADWNAYDQYEVAIPLEDAADCLDKVCIPSLSLACAKNSIIHPE